MSNPAMEEAPKQEEMGGDLCQKHFGPHDAMLVKQTMRGCFQECLGCEAKSEFKVAPLDFKNIEDGYKVNDPAKNEEETLYALEKSSFLCRCCWRDGRPFDMQVTEGKEEGGQSVVSYKKPCGCPLYFDIPTNNGDISIPCCCNLPKVDTHVNGQPTGSSSEYLCDCCLYVPKFKYLENGSIVYILKPETCCGGFCINCSCSGKGCIYIPFYFHDKDMQPIVPYSDNAPQIRKVWAGWKKECCSTADTFAVKFPDNIDAKRKAALLGMTFLIDFVWFERQQDK